MADVIIQLGNQKYKFPDQESADKATAAYKQSVLSKYSPDVQAIAAGLANYQTPLPSRLPNNSPYFQAVRAVQELDPEWSMAEYEARRKLMSDFGAGGKHQDMVRNFNNAILHLGSMKEATDKMDNGTIEPLTWLKNQAAQRFQSMDRAKALKEFTSGREIVSSEIPKAIRGGQIAEQDIQRMNQQLNENDSKDMQTTAEMTLLKYLSAQVKNLQNQYMSGGVKPPRNFKFLYPEAREALIKLKQDPSEFDLAGQPAAPAQVGTAPPSLDSFWKKGNDD